MASIEYLPQGPQTIKQAKINTLLKMLVLIIKGTPHQRFSVKPSENMHVKTAETYSLSYFQVKMLIIK